MKIILGAQSGSGNDFQFLEIVPAHFSILLSAPFAGLGVRASIKESANVSSLSTEVSSFNEWVISSSGALSSMFHFFQKIVCATILEFVSQFHCFIVFTFRITKTFEQENRLS